MLSARWLLPLIVLSCGGKTGLYDGRIAEDAGSLGPCSDLRPCATAHCSLVVPSGALPIDARVDLTEQALPPELTGETTAPFLCSVEASGTPAAPLVLTVKPASTVSPDWTVFRYDQRRPESMQSSTPTGDRIQAFVPGSGAYAVTIKPGDWKLDTRFEDDPLASSDTPSLLRNLTRQLTFAAYWDGRRFYLGSGPRVLIWEGIPAPGTKPSVVVGASELDVIPSGTSSSNIGATVAAIWSDGTKLVVAAGNRVLVWSTIPTTNFATADLVLGQQDFVSNSPNPGGVSASTFFQPSAIDSDGDRLIVGDALNHRALVWSKFPTSLGQPATSVLGQSTFAASEPGLFNQAFGVCLDGSGAFVASYFTGAFRFDSLATTATASSNPIPGGGPGRVQPSALPRASGVALVPGGVAFADPYGFRVAIHRNDAATPIRHVLGQPDATRMAVNPVSASTVSESARLVSAHGLTLIPDRTRVLVYDEPPTYNFEPASRVIGQAGFTVADSTADYRRISRRTLGYPADVAVNSRTLAIADTANSRVLLYDPNLPATNASASVVLGQPTDVAFVPNVDQRSPSASTLSGPSSVALDDQHLYVADTENHRILVWSPIPTQSGTPATVVLGQADFRGRRPNHGNLDADGDGYADADARSLFSPSGVATDGQLLFVSDRLNHRVLVWNVPTLSTGKAADAVIGQSSFMANRANRGGGAYAPTVDGFNLPTGVAVAGAALWVADTENNRIVRWDDVRGTPSVGAVLGQPDGFTVSSPNVEPLESPNAGVQTNPAVNAETVFRPRAIAADGDRLFVSETGAHRVHVFERSGATFTPAGQIGQRSATTKIPNENGIGPSTLSSPLGIAVRAGVLLVADSANHRVLTFDAATPPSGATARAVIGQPSFVSSGFDQSAAVTAGGATRPRGLALADGALYVAETSRHRVLVHDLPLTLGKTPRVILGQSDPTLSLPNAGALPTASSLASPEGVFADRERVVVADTGNHRVLVFDRDGTQASVVLGQGSFEANLKNRGGGPTRQTLAGPTGAFVQGAQLFVADTSNHRVLVWNSLPTGNGQPPDVVLGQVDFDSNLPNRGDAAASPRSLSLPTAVYADADHMFVADSGNNRVLRYDLPVATNAAATVALGQADLTSRVASTDINDIARLSGPVALTSDGVTLFVADRDANRVVAYDLARATTGMVARTLLNANTGLVAVGPAGLAVERTPLFTTRLFVSDTNNDRILVLSPLSRLY